MKIIILLILGILHYSLCFSQSCLPEGIWFESQAQIDSFQYTYPYCTKIEGDVHIGYGVEIDNLLGLLQIKEIGGTLDISSNFYLVNLAGLDSLITIGDSLMIYDNDGLIDLNGLDNLDSIGGDLIVRYNWDMTSLSGLESLTTIGGDISIGNNFYLTSLSGINNINSYSINNLGIYENSSLINCEVQSVCDYLVAPNGIVDIYKNGPGCTNHAEMMNRCGNPPSCLPYGNYYFLTQTEVDSFQTHYPNCSELFGNVHINNDVYNVNGLTTINSIEGDLWIGSVPVGNIYLEDLTGLEGLEVIGGDLYIYGNFSLNSLSGLNNLISLNGSIYIRENNLLISLSGLDNIEAISILNLTIRNNSSLSTCDVRSICDYLASPTGDVFISSNASGCNSEDEVLAACTVELDEHLLQSNHFTLYPNPFSERITLEFLEFSKQKNSYTLSIFDIKGQLITRLQISEPQKTLDISRLNTGIYFLRIISQDNVFEGKIMKK